MTAAMAADARVAVVDSRFEPRQVTINTGEKVTWTFSGNAPHSVTADDGSFDSHPNCSRANFVACSSATSPPFERTFTRAGTFAYHCKIHGSSGGGGMSGVVVVNGPPSATSAPTTAAPTTAAPTTAAPTTARPTTTPTTAPTTTSTSTPDEETTTTTSSSTTTTAVELAIDDANSDDDGGIGAAWIALGALMALAVGGYAAYQLIQTRRLGGT